MITLKFEHPHFDENKEFAINGLGAVMNGSSIDIDEDQERFFIIENGKTIEDAFKNNASVSISGSSVLSSDEVKSLLPQPVLTDAVPEQPEVIITSPENDEGVNDNV